MQLKVSSLFEAPATNFDTGLIGGNRVIQSKFAAARSWEENCWRVSVEHEWTDVR